MSSTAERLKAAKERDEAGIEQDEPEAPKFEGPENPTEPEPEPEPTPEPEPEPEPEPPPEGTLSAEQAAELEKATAAYFKRVEKVFGADKVPDPCPACEGIGFDLTGGMGQPSYVEHDHFITCDECDGLGQVKTGSHVLGHELHDCPRCLARGYLERLPGPQAVAEQPQEFGTPAWMGNVAPGPGQ